MEHNSNKTFVLQNIGVYIFLFVMFCCESASIEMDEYHTHGELTEFLQSLSKKYPNITNLYSIGNSTEGKELWVMAITGDNLPSKHKPKVKLVANIHGDEAVGREVLLKFIEYLVINYNSKNTKVTQLLNYAQVHILPSLNPDGFEMARKTYITKVYEDCIKLPGRTNRGDMDLNRNFPDYFRSNTLPLQVETQAVMRWLNNTSFVLSASIHGGAVVAVYPFDNTQDDDSSHEPSITPDDDVFKHLATVYAQTHPTMHKGVHCKDTKEIKFSGGIVNGASWYTFTGGMQDYNYVRGCMEVTLEISCCKFPKATELSKYWEENKEPLMVYLMQVMRGVHGIVRDSFGNPLSGVTLMVQGRNVSPFSTTETGQFWRILMPGDYLLKVSAEGYRSKSLPFTVPESRNVTQLQSAYLEVRLDPNIPDPTTVKSPKTTENSKTESVFEEAEIITEPALNEVKHKGEFMIGASRSGVRNKYCSFVVLLILLVVIFF